MQVKNARREDAYCFSTAFINLLMPLLARHPLPSPTITFALWKWIYCCFGSNLLWNKDKLPNTDPSLHVRGMSQHEVHHQVYFEVFFITWEVSLWVLWQIMWFDRSAINGARDKQGLNFLISYLGSCFYSAPFTHASELMHCCSEMVINKSSQVSPYKKQEYLKWDSISIIFSTCWCSQSNVWLLLCVWLLCLGSFLSHSVCYREVLGA